MTPFVVVAAVGIGSYLFRVSMLVLAARSGLPPIVDRAAAYAVPVSFAALATTAVAPQLETHAAALAPLISLLVAVVAVRRTGSPHAALLAGMPTLWVMSAVVPR